MVRALQLKQLAFNLDLSAISALFIPLFLGASLLFVAGISNANAVHDAAHDARHAFGWVCH